MGRPKMVAMEARSTKERGEHVKPLLLASSDWLCLPRSAGQCWSSKSHEAFGQLQRTRMVTIRPGGHHTMFFDPTYGCRVRLLGGRVFEEDPSLRRAVDRLGEKLLKSEVFMRS